MISGHVIGSALIAAILEASMIKRFIVRQAISPETSAALKVLAEQRREAMPANWSGVDEDWAAAIEIMNDQGIPLIWVPRGNIVGALMSASGTAQRHTILLGARDDVATDCLAVLAEVTALELAPLAGLAADSGRALRDGHYAASQALSANVFDTWLRDVVSRGKLFKPPGDREPFYGAIKRQIIGLSGKTSVGSSRRPVRCLRC